MRDSIVWLAVVLAGAGSLAASAVPSPEFPWAGTDIAGLQRLMGEGKLLSLAADFEGRVPAIRGNAGNPQ